MVHSPDFFPETSHFSLIVVFCTALVERAGDDGRWYVQLAAMPYGTYICHYDHTFI